MWEEEGEQHTTWEERPHGESAISTGPALSPPSGSALGKAQRVENRSSWQAVGSSGSEGEEGKEPQIRSPSLLRSSLRARVQDRIRSITTAKTNDPICTPSPYSFTTSTLKLSDEKFLLAKTISSPSSGQTKRLNAL